MEALNEIITKELKRQPRIKRAYGIITKEIKTEDGMSTKKYKVLVTNDFEKIQSIQNEINSAIEGGASINDVSIDSSNDLTFVDRTNETSSDILKPGDCVWIYYWNTLSDGYIAMKVGISHLWGTLDVRPYHRTSSVNDAYVIKVPEWW